MRCDDFERKLSDYIEGDLNEQRNNEMEHHILWCSACQETLSGVLQVRQALSGLSDVSPPARFKLALFGFLHENLATGRRFWSSPVTLGLAAAAALAILLWPEQPVETGGAAAWGPSQQVQAPLKRVWGERFPEIQRIRPTRRVGSYSHAQVRAVSF